MFESCRAHHPAARMVARRLVIDLNRTLPPACARALADRVLIRGRQILRDQTHACLPALAVKAKPLSAP